jgi:hypothetical protein
MTVVLQVEFSLFELAEHQPPFQTGTTGRGCTMKTLTIAAFAAFALTTAASAADLPVKAKPIVAPDPPAWDLAFGSAISSDYIFRGITQSAHKPSGAAYFEPRYNFTKDLQGYVGLGAASIDFPNRAAAEVDIYGGIRPTFGKFAFDFGGWYYWYPGGQCYSAATGPLANGNNFDCFQPGAFSVGGVPFAAATPAALPNGNIIKKDLSFFEAFAKVNYTFNDNFGVGAYVYYSPSVLNSGASGVFFGGTAKYTFNAWSNGVQPYVSGEVGHWDLGTSDSFYGIPGTTFANGIPYKDYTTWNLGIGATWKVFTLDLRYIDTDLSKANCNAFTSDQTARFNNSFSPINTTGVGSNWCGSRFVARLSADLTVNTNLK